MIEKLGNPIGRSLLTQIEPEKKESVSSPPQRQEFVKISNPVQEAKVAQTMKGDLALAGSLNMAVLGAQLSQPAVVGQTSPPVASAPPEITTAGQPLKLNSKGPEVEQLQSDLNIWRRENNLPEIPTTGVYTTETEQAVKDFQKASSLTESGIVDDSTKLRLQLEQSPEYKALDPRIKDHVSMAYSTRENDPEGRKNLVNLVRDESFAYLLSPGAQSSAVSGLMQAPNTSNLESTKRLVVHAAILEKNGNFDKLPEGTKQDVLDTMFYKTTHGGLTTESGSNSVTALATDPNFGKLTSNQQSQFLEIVRKNPDPATGSFFLRELMKETTFQSMNPMMQRQVINIAYQNAMNASETGNWRQNDEQFQQLWGLMRDPAFSQAPDDEKSAQLNGLSGRTGM